MMPRYIRVLFFRGKNCCFVCESRAFLWRAFNSVCDGGVPGVSPPTHRFSMTVSGGDGGGGGGGEGGGGGNKSDPPVQTAPPSVGGKGGGSPNPFLVSLGIK